MLGKERSVKIRMVVTGCNLNLFSTMPALKKKRKKKHFKKKQNGYFGECG
jgi:hypothetical protein